jgi:hypothetical protein
LSTTTGLHCKTISAFLGKFKTDHFIFRKAISFLVEPARVQWCLFFRTMRVLQRETRTPLLYTYHGKGITRILKPCATQGSFLYTLLVFGSYRYSSINLGAYLTPVVLNLLVFTYPKAKMKTKFGILCTP